MEVGLLDPSTHPLAADQATTAVEAGIRNLNRVNIDQIPPEARNFGTYKIFNVFDEHHIQSTGVGTFFIAPCEEGFVWEPDGKSHDYIRREAKKGEIPYSRPCQVPKIVYEGIRKEIERVEWRQWSGRDVVNDILGVGQRMKPHQSLLVWGCFLAAGDVPTRQELEAAVKQVALKMREYQREAQKEYQKGPNNYENISEAMRKADAWLVARSLSVPSAWNSEMIASVACPGCGEAVNPNIAFHKACGAIINEEKYKSIKWAKGSAGAKAGE